MTAETTQTKTEIIDRILACDAYGKDSKMRNNVAAKLATLSLENLHNLDLILLFRVIESNELDRKVQRILAN